MRFYSGGIGQGRRIPVEIRSMSDPVILALSWIFFAIHLAVGVAAVRHRTALPLVPMVNAAVALGVLGYWMTRWYSYIFQGIKWYASDQALPLYAAVVLAFCIATLAGSFKGTVLHGVVLGIDGLAFVHLTSRDVVRHRIVQDIVNAYARSEASSRTDGKAG